MSGRQRAAGHTVVPDGARRSGREEGAATVLVAVAIVALVGVASVALSVAGLLSARHRAAAAADFAALAAADALAHGGDPCTSAAVLAEANGARLRSCVPQWTPSTAVVVEVVLVRHVWWWGAVSLSGVAKAGVTS